MGWVGGRGKVDKEGGTEGEEEEEDVWTCLIIFRDTTKETSTTLIYISLSYSAHGRFQHTHPIYNQQAPYC